MTSSHLFHSLESEKGPISFTFQHTHTGMVDTKSSPPLREFSLPNHIVFVLSVLTKMELPLLNVSKLVKPTCIKNNSHCNFWIYVLNIDSSVICSIVVIQVKDFQTEKTIEIQLDRSTEVCGKV